MTDRGGALATTSTTRSLLADSSETAGSDMFSPRATEATSEPAANV
ncbi:hypothetical protein SGL43_07405 [Streptomyces globisporus]|uniref:Uncharacterized protein n=1 Tax=Streptomyces globisporus TaxID=1908 RepID=A0ABN8VBX4_STRGL|nr:hypothetical protein SGL43_07405 [Streptomyces globisporus]